MATGVELATAWVRVVPTMDGVQGAISDALNPAQQIANEEGKKAGGLFTGSFGKNIAGIGLAIGAAFATRAVVDWARDSIDALKQWETINAQTEAAVSSTGGAANITADQVHELSTSLEGLTATQAESIQGGANMLLTFKNIRNEVGDGNDIFNQATAALVDMSRAMGTEPQTAAIQLGKALNDPIQGISALSRVGIQFTEDQKAQIQALVESGQTMEAQKIILAELQSQFGGSGAAYADTFAGKMFLLDDAVGDLGETIFSALMPVLMDLVSFGTDVFGWLTENQGALIAVVSIIGVLLVAAFIAWTASIWASTVALLANPVTWIILAIVALIAIIVLLVMNWDQVVAWITDIWSGFVGWLTDGLNALGSWWNDLWAGIFNWAKDLWQGYQQWVVDIFAGLLGFLRDTGTNLTNWWNGLWGGLASFVEDAFRNIGNFVIGALNTVIDLVNGAIGGINDLGSLASDVTGGVIGWNITKLPHIPMLAEGGRAIRGGSVLVGERGPEILNIPRGASVVPLDRAGGRPAAAFNNYGTIQVTDERALVREVSLRQQEANVLAGIGEVVS